MKLWNLIIAVLPILHVGIAEVNGDQHAQHNDRPIQKRSSPMEPYRMQTRGGYEVTLADYKDPKVPVEIAMQYLVASICDLFESVSPFPLLCSKITASKDCMPAYSSVTWQSFGRIGDFPRLKVD